MPSKYGYSGATGKGTQTIDGKKYTLWGWLTRLDKQKSSDVHFAIGQQFSTLRKKNFVRLEKRGNIYAVWTRSK